MRNILIIIGMVVFLVGCEAMMGQPAAPVKPDPVKVELLKAQKELNVLKGRPETEEMITMVSLVEEEVDPILKNASGKVLVRVRIVSINDNDESDCSPRSRVIVQVVTTGERRYLCGAIGKERDIFTIEWNLLKKWR